MRITAEKTSLFLQEIERAVFGTAQTEIATILLALSREESSIALTQERLAQLAGLTRVTVGVQLHELERIGAIRLGRSKITVIRRETLIAMGSAHCEAGGSMPHEVRRLF
jgi:CRP-like cAMP-binding protein